MNSGSQRPDPDLLLAKMQRQEEQSRRGQLRIYFGSSAGVGKTYAMLAAAHKRNSPADIASPRRRGSA